ncbi:hypothetical protein [Halorussus vallis]|uniref:hypothetical protein n=1 Tax=Halorussus vallis TaxID=2953749 RepID=UPI0034A3CAA2
MDFLLVGVPGLIVLYGGVRLSETAIDPDTYPRIVAWCLAGFVVVLAVIELLNLEPGVTIAYPRWSFTLGTAFGIAAGFGVGVNDARAPSRTHERSSGTTEPSNARTTDRTRSPGWSPTNSRTRSPSPRYTSNESPRATTPRSGK